MLISAQATWSETSLSFVLFWALKKYPFSTSSDHPRLCLTKSQVNKHLNVVKEIIICGIIQIVILYLMRCYLYFDILITNSGRTDPFLSDTICAHIFINLPSELNRSQSFAANLWLVPFLEVEQETEDPLSTKNLKVSGQN